MRALRQFTWTTGKSTGRNSSGQITVFHRGGRSNTLSMGIVERIEYDPNQGEGVRRRKCNTIEEFAPLHKIRESTTTTIRGPFSFSSLPGKVDKRKVACFSPGLKAAYVVVGLPTRMSSCKETCAKDVFFSALSSLNPKGETASLSFGSSFDFPRITVVGAKPTFFAPQMREKARGKNTTHSILWAHRTKRKAVLSWHIFRWHNKSKLKMDQGSLLAKPIGEGAKNRTCKVDRLTSEHMIGERRNTHEAPVERESLPGCMPMGAGFFEKAWADSKTWDLGLATNEGKFKELSLPAAYIVVGLIKLTKLHFPALFPY
ncbi:hypothetical protein M9H77_36285 [Catharanthus roseus]|uniref:Uncharacterized protein n=1 Tax=Catharanthus roseus TaxID=4058 RepID=A0ACB9ZS86_CATRO|nr:hypothetical protein M9H77_36285 [Catharanthus roseus]